MKATFHYIDDEGKKQSSYGSKDGAEVVHRVIYLISYEKWKQEIKKLQGMV